MSKPDDAVIDEYAIQLAKFPNDGMKAALIATANDMGDALELAAWCRQNNVAFEARQRELIAETGAKPFIPDKETVIVEILTIARNVEANGDLRLRAYKLAGEMAGYISNDPKVAIHNNITNKVMQVTTFPNEDVWEKTAVASQAKLIDAAYAKA